VENVKTTAYIRKGRLREALDLEWYLKTRKKGSRERLEG
jgi:hypothetical protein